MKYHNLLQGSKEWLALRGGFFTASEAPAMMGSSPKVSRTELINMKATGSEREFSDWVQRNLFDKGHEYEALARPIIEELIDEELFPATGTKDFDGLPLLASFDGLTMLGDVVFEHKMLNQSLAQKVRESDLPDEYRWQLDQQLLISGADKAIFVVSDGSRENLVWMQYEASPERFEQLMTGWKQFAEDLANYTPTETKPEAVGRTPGNLPALHIELTGAVTSSNLAEYKAHALELLAGINRDLVTDQDFADAERTVKWCKDVEDRIVATKQHALSQTASIEEVFRTMDDVSEEVRRIRLELDKLVKSEKDNRRLQIRLAAEDDLSKHLQAMNKRLAVVEMPEIKCDIVGAMKGKRTIASLEDAANTAVANAKIEATQWAEKIEKNLALIAEIGDGCEYLFADKQNLVLKDADELCSLIKARILTHEAEAKAKAEAERDRIRREEEAKAQAAAAPAAAPKPKPEQRPAKAATPAKDSPAPWELEQETVTIPLDEYRKLQADSAMLQALIAAEVRVWSGWDEACAAVRENTEATA